MPRPRRTLTPEMLDRLWDLADDGKSQVYIARELGVAPSTVSRELNKSRPGRDGDVMTLTEMIAAGTALKAAAAADPDAYCWGHWSDENCGLKRCAGRP